MTQEEQSQPHLYEIDLGPEVKLILEQISKGLESNWDQGTTGLQYVISYGGVRELMVKLVDHRQVSHSFRFMTKANSRKELRGKDFRFMRFKTKRLFEAREPVYFYPLRIGPGSSPLIATAAFEVGKRISVTQNEEITPEVDVLVAKQC